MFSKACEYAIKAAIYIAQKSTRDERPNVKSVSGSINAPEAFTAKVLQQLCRADILESTRGKQGGFIFTLEKQQRTKIYDVVRLFDGESLFTSCGLGLRECSELNPCPVHEDYKNIRENIIRLTQKYSFSELAEKTEDGLAWLK